MQNQNNEPLDELPLLEPEGSIERVVKGKTELMYAAERGDVERARVLLMNGADIYAKDANQKSAFDYGRTNWGCFRLFQEHVENIKLLKEAAINNNLKEFKTLLKRVHYTVKDKNGANILMYAAMSPETDIIRYLLETYPYMLQIDQKDDNGANVLMYAAMGSGTKVMQYLLNTYPPKFQIKQTDQNQKTLLMYATEKDNVQAVEFLMKGVNINEQDKYGQTALNYAIRHGSVQSLAKLVCFGATITGGYEYNCIRTSLFCSNRHLLNNEVLKAAKTKLDDVGKALTEMKELISIKNEPFFNTKETQNLGL